MAGLLVARSPLAPVSASLRRQAFVPGLPYSGIVRRRDASISLWIEPSPR